MTKLVFMGTPAFSVPILRGLVEAGYEVLAVVTQPDRPVGRKRILTAPPVKVAAEELNLKVLQPEKIAGSPEMAEILRLKPNLLITAAFGQFLPEALLAAPKNGALNVHASLLPKYRGGAPVHYAIYNGDSETGVTIMEMIKKMDAGGIYSQRRVEISEKDTVGTMFEKLSILGRDLLLETLPDILSGKTRPIPQTEEAVTFAPNITREQEQIDWHRSAVEVDRQVRAFYPWPVAYTIYKGKRWKILKAHVADQSSHYAAGTLLLPDHQKLQVVCEAGTVLTIEELQPAGRSALSAIEFLRGAGQAIQEGECLE